MSFLGSPDLWESIDYNFTDLNFNTTYDIESNMNNENENIIIPTLKSIDFWNADDIMNWIVGKYDENDKNYEVVNLKHFQNMTGREFLTLSEEFFLTIDSENGLWLYKRIQQLAFEQNNMNFTSQKMGKLWEFIRDMLQNPEYSPKLICWENRKDGIFRFVSSSEVARIWGSRRNNDKMNYEKLSRAIRYYYKSKIFLPVKGKRLVYQFGPCATGLDQGI